MYLISYRLVFYMFYKLCFATLLWSVGLSVQTVDPSVGHWNYPVHRMLYNSSATSVLTVYDFHCTYHFVAMLTTIHSYHWQLLAHACDKIFIQAIDNFMQTLLNGSEISSHWLFMHPYNTLSFTLNKLPIHFRSVYWNITELCQ